MILTLAVIVWLILGLAVAVLVGAGTHGPAQPGRSIRRYVPSTSIGRADVGAPTSVRQLYVVDRSHAAPSTTRNLVLPKHRRS